MSMVVNRLTKFWELSVRLNFPQTTKPFDCPLEFCSTTWSCVCAESIVNGANRTARSNNMSGTKPGFSDRRSNKQYALTSEKSINRKRVLGEVVLQRVRYHGQINLLAHSCASAMIVHCGFTPALSGKMLPSQIRTLLNPRSRNCAAITPICGSSLIAFPPLG